MLCSCSHYNASYSSATCTVNNTITVSKLKRKDILRAFFLQLQVSKWLQSQLQTFTIAAATKQRTVLLAAKIFAITITLHTHASNQTPPEWNWYRKILSFSNYMIGGTVAYQDLMLVCHICISRNNFSLLLGGITLLAKTIELERRFEQRLAKLIRSSVMITQRVMCKPWPRLSYHQKVC